MARHDCRDTECIFCSIAHEILAELDRLTDADERVTCVYLAVESTFEAGMKCAQAKANGGAPILPIPELTRTENRTVGRGVA